MMTRKALAGAILVAGLSGLWSCRNQLEEAVYIEDIVRELLSKSSQLTQEEYAMMIGQLRAATDILDVGGASGVVGEYIIEGSARMDSCLTEAAANDLLDAENLRAFRRWQASRPHCHLSPVNP